LKVLRNQDEFGTNCAVDKHTKHQWKSYIGRYSKVQISADNVGEPIPVSKAYDLELHQFAKSYVLLVILFYQRIESKNFAAFPHCFSAALKVRCSVFQCRL